MTDDAEIDISPAPLVRGRHGAVASPHRLATEAGVAMLRAGGSAVDAAIATNAVLGVVAGAQCGLGGDAFWLVWDAREQQLRALNGSGRSGRSASIGAVREDGHSTMPDHGRWTITVPGAVDSWAAAHERYGRLDWRDLFDAAIDAATGFPADDGWITMVERGAARFGTGDDWARTYRPHGRAWQPGETVELAALARSLRTIADTGARTAYDGPLADRIAASFAEQGVPIDAGDLAEHHAEWVDPIGIDYRGVMSMAHPPNSVGAISLLTLALLERAGPANDATHGATGWDDVGWIHRGLEASRIALAERDRQITDPDFMASDAVERLLASDHVDRLAAMLDAERVLPHRESTLPPGGGTVYVAAADRWGGVVSLLQSNFRLFGSGVVDAATGICFQDRGGFFRLDPGHTNALEPRKRPTHTLTPGMLFRDGRPWIAHGSMGGEIQPQIFAQFVSAVVDGGADVATAISAPRWAAVIPGPLRPPSITRLESRVPATIVRSLADMGHRIDTVTAWSSLLGHGHAIELGDEDASFAAAADPRSGGSAAAF